MNFSKSILSVALLVSVVSANAYIGESLISKAAISYRFGQAKDAVASVCAKVPSFAQAKVMTANFADEAKFKVAPYMTKRTAAVATATGVVVAGSVAAYKKGYFGKAANFVSKNFVTAKNAVVAKFASKK